MSDAEIKVLYTFLEFCYITHCNIHDMRGLDEMDEALGCYHHYCEIFLTTGVQTISISLINICSFITESKHIKAVKEPWQQSSCFDALCQMLLSNQCTNKLAAARADFKRQDMLKGTCLSWILIKLGMFSAPT